MALVFLLHIIACLLFFCGVPAVTAWLIGLSPTEIDASALAWTSVNCYMAGVVLIWLTATLFSTWHYMSCFTANSSSINATAFWLPSIFLAIWIVRGTLMTRYDVFLGTDLTPQKHQEFSYFFVVAMFMINTLSKGALVLSCWQKRDWQWRQCVLAYLFLIGEILYAIFYSRRYLLEIIAIFIIVRGMFWSRARLQQALVIGLLMLPIAIAGMLFMITVRNYYQMLKPIAGSAATAAPLALQGSLISPLEEKLRYLKANLAERPLLIEFNRRIAEAQIQTGAKMGGQAFLHNFRWILPRFIFPEKLGMPTPEEYIEEFYGLPRFDLGSNWAAFGLADGGLVGAFLAGLGFASALIIFFKLGWWLTNRFHLQFFPFCVLGAIINLAVQVEQEPLDLLIFVRALLIFAFCEYGFNLIIRFLKASIRHPKGLLVFQRGNSGPAD